jgi:hypothetical protein
MLIQQGIESDHFRVKENMPKIGSFLSFNTARRTIAGLKAMLWLRRGFGFTGGWTVKDQNDCVVCEVSRLTATLVRAPEAGHHPLRACIAAPSDTKTAPCPRRHSKRFSLLVCRKP